MPKKKKNSAKRKGFIKTRHLLLFFLVLSVITGVFIYRELGRDVFQKKEEALPKQSPATEERTQTRPEEKTTVPRIAIVIDDLGPDKKPVNALLALNVPLTLSVLPHETYSSWIAGEGKSRGHDVIAHIPMEAKDPHRLGKGGLYTWMTDDEIKETLKEGILTTPHIQAISNHMGSAFTEDERVMIVLISILKEQGMFFLDSLTTQNSVAERIARQRGVKILQRDIFLDNADDPASIEAEWRKLIDVARKKGYAVALAHPRKNTIDFLTRKLPESKVKLVPLSELLLN